MQTAKPIQSIPKMATLKTKRTSLRTKNLR